MKENVSHNEILAITFCKWGFCSWACRVEWNLWWWNITVVI